ncbi:hypothetical protein B0H16DRAFT_581052 [Mycena metata]|uniref:Uncharacterized protein n=1 Tax=Mycena metata TaxID=1033252 RepID=A0AAD7H584_9AGAR|nr:hypothetical protein B0H16DRAFT_581052 [Mycena metata]
MGDLLSLLHSATIFLLLNSFHPGRCGRSSKNRGKLPYNSAVANNEEAASLLSPVMSQLRRWSTPQSVYSHWSDSTPIGPSFPIHALAKPLSKFLYHRQATGIIAKMGGSPLSVETVEVLTTYLMFKDIFPSTRALVLDHLGARAFHSEADAQLVMNNVLGLVPELLSSSVPDIIYGICWLLNSLTRHKKLKATILCGLELHPHLVPFLNHRDLVVQSSAAYALGDLDRVETLLGHLFLSLAFTLCGKLTSTV